MERHNVVAPGFVPPRGYQDAVVVAGAGTWLVLGGHVAFDAERRLLHPGDLLGQFRVVLRNLRATVESAGFAVEDLVKLVVHVTDVAAYRASVKPLGAIWREELGRHFPAMTLLGTTALMEPGAVVEIDGLAAR
ncbi:MAG TPA: Rid family hydrolase [Planctomycetota bacterium]|nr:Rid family hydrolase [Planctomycetota bacterium]